MKVRMLVNAGKRAQKHYETTTNVDKVRTNEGCFKIRFARDENTIPPPQLSGSHWENRATQRATFNSFYHHSQTAICELSYDMTNFMTASSFPTTLLRTSCFYKRSPVESSVRSPKD